MDLNVLIVGGGVQGVGLLHDLASRGVRGLFLAEQGKLASGTSSRSTKLVHGGLRYLEHVSQWPLVHEALQERGLLLRLLPELIRPLPFVLPNFKGSRPPLLVKTGLFLYDFLSGDSGLPRSFSITKNGILERAPYLNRTWVESEVQSGFVFYDAQMIDDAIVRLAAFSAQKMGARFYENTKVTKIVPLPYNAGFKVTLESLGKQTEVTSKIVINAAGAWNNANLLRWGFWPQVGSLLNLGTHLVFDGSDWPMPPNGAAPHATLIQNTDGRVLFMIPWYNQWLFGTTESLFQKNVKDIAPPQEDIDYLKAALVHTMGPHIPPYREVFCGLRTMATALSDTTTAQTTLRASWQEAPFTSPFYGPQLNHNGTSISALSRESTTTVHNKGLFSIYGGKYTTYRAQSQRLGNTICTTLGVGGMSRTASRPSWFLEELLNERPSDLESAPGIRQLQVG